MIALSLVFLLKTSAFDIDSGLPITILSDHRVALDKETFETMWQDSEPDEGGVVAELFFRHTHTEFRADDIDPSPWLDYMPDVSSPFCFGAAFAMHTLLNKRHRTVPSDVRT